MTCIFSCTSQVSYIDITCILHVFLQGADTNLKCHWTDMNALHYAIFFDCNDVVDRLCEHNPGSKKNGEYYTFRNDLLN